MTRIYLIRHGETEMNQKGCYYGWTDCSLSELGISQAHSLKAAFEAIPIDVTVASDLKRAVETARIIRDDGIITDNRLRELNFGSWEGRHFRELMQQDEQRWSKWTADWIDAAPAEGESFRSMYKRVSCCMEDIIQSYRDKNIAIVGHNGSLRIIAAYLLQLPMEKIWCFSFDHGKYSLLELTDRHCSIRSINII